MSSSLNHGDENSDGGDESASTLARLEALLPDTLHEVDAVLAGDALDAARVDWVLLAGFFLLM